MDHELGIASEPASRLDGVIAAALLSIDRGEDLDLAALIRGYPDLEGELREFFNDDKLAVHIASLLKDSDSVESATHVVSSDATQPAAPLVIPGFEVQGVVAEGGMGVVYRAVQLSLGRTVALKVLSPAWKSSSERLKRFKEEARLAASLHLSHVLVIHDILDIDDSPVVVMPFIEGCTLRSIIVARRQNPSADEHPLCTEWRGLNTEQYLKRILVLLDKVIEATADLHRAGVLHRDIKPSNILVDTLGNPWLADFGLAQLLATDAPGDEPLGTLGYMAPEQSSGGKVDARTDIFAIGVTIYEALALERPYGKKVISASHQLPRSPSRMQRKLSRDFDAIIQKALDPLYERRYRTIDDFRSDWGRVRQGLLPTIGQVGWTDVFLRRIWANRVIAMTAALVAIAVVITWYFVAPPDNRRVVVIPTNPKCAQIAIAPLDDATGQPTDPVRISDQPSETGEFSFKSVPPGDYLVVGLTANGRFHEVYRHVPAKADITGKYKHQRWLVRKDGAIELPIIKIVDVDHRNMRHYDAVHGFGMGIAAFDPAAARMYETDVSEFWLDTREVTVAEFCKEFPEVRSRLPKEANGDDAMSQVNYEEVLAFLERVGKRPMTEAEYEMAATCGGTTAFPWGDDGTVITDWSFGRVGSAAFDRTPTKPEVHGLYSNVAEWTSSKLANAPLLAMTAKSPDFLKELSNKQLIKGGSYSVALGKAAASDLQLGPRFRHVVDRDQSFPGIGFRGAVSARPHFLKLGNAQSQPGPTEQGR
jgi:hypothetical protein